MDSVLGRALCQVSTSCQWATLSGVVTKVNKKLAVEEHVDARSLVAFMASINKEELNNAGVWVHSFGAQFQPIVIMNPARARARRTEKDSTTSGVPTCTCSCGGGAPADTAGRYFASTDYNAGRHAVEGSGHRPNCACWTPPTTSHLHSWRRGFES